MGMDTFYISHGSPMLSVDDSMPARQFLQSWGPAGLAGPKPPRAILVVSGHWETDTPAVNAIRGTNDTIYDFYNFPSECTRYTIPVAFIGFQTGKHKQCCCAQLKYPAPGAPDVAEKTKHLLEDAGFGPVTEDNRRGLDHGAWIPLMLMYPDANIPVCQLSVQTDRDATYHYDLGRALAPLREDGVLIVGSGSATHNLRRILSTFEPSSHVPPPAWAVEFDNWLREALLAGRHGDVKRYLEKAPHAETVHPSPDHFYPLHVALGAAGDGCRAELIHQSWSNASLSYASYRFTTNKN